MASVICLTFNPFQENTYIVDDETGECIIFDPGCMNPNEEQHLVKTLADKKLTPVKLINTHCHLDHVFGNKFVADTYKLPLGIHEGELIVLQSVPAVCKAYNLPLPAPSPMPEYFIEEGEIITFGNTELKVLFTPGHSPASICFYNSKDAFVIAGDVLFQNSIGRTDLPGGDHQTLLDSVKTQLFVLPDDVEVWPGHGSSTTIGYERENNPFF